MVAAEWGVVALVVITLLQVPGLLYLARLADRDEREREGEQPAPEDRYAVGTGVVDTTTERVSESGSPPEPAPSTARPPHPSRVRCGDCGASNDVGYRFCRECVAALGR